MKQGDWVVPCAAASPILACSFRFASHQQNNEPPRSTGARTSALSPNLTRRMEMTLHRTLRYTLAFALLGPPAAAGGPSSAKARVYRNVRCNVISILLVRFGDRADVQAPVERGGSLFCWWDAKRNEQANIGDAAAHGTTQSPCFIRHGRVVRPLYRPHHDQRGADRRHTDSRPPLAARYTWLTDKHNRQFAKST